MTARKTALFNVMVGILLFSIFAPLVSADVSIIFPSPAPTSINLNPFTPNQIIEFENTNISQDIFLGFSVSSNLQDYVSLTRTTLDIGVSPYKGSVTLSIPSEGVGEGGSFSGDFIYTFGSTTRTIDLNVVIPPAEEEVQSDIIVFPTSQIITVKQDSEKSQNILLTVPSTYPRTVTINAVNFNPGTEPIRFGDLNLGQVAPGQSVQIPIIYSGVDAETGTYQTSLSVLATDSLGQVHLPSISLQLQVTAGTSPITEDTFSTPPTCSLSGTTLNVNNTYTFTCSSIVNNLEVVIPSNDYYIGQKVETTAGIYRYDFSPIEYGETEFKAEFRYKGASIFAPFKQDIRITSSGSVIPGTSLKFVFTPSLESATSGAPVLIQIVDNKTGSLVSDPKLWIDAKSVNVSDEAFEYTFEAGDDYELRGVSPGYDNLLQTITFNPKILTISVNPPTGDSSTSFNITVNVENATLNVGGLTYNGNYYGTLRPGINEVTASKKGYSDTTINISVEDFVRVVNGGADFKKGDEVTFTLNRNVTTFRIIYQEDLEDTTSEEYFNGGAGAVFTFTPKKGGVYILEAEGANIATYQTTGFSFKNKWWFMPAWAWILIIGAIVLLIIVILAMRGGGEYTPKQDDSGLTYPVGDAS